MTARHNKFVIRQTRHTRSVVGWETPSEVFHINYAKTSSLPCNPRFECKRSPHVSIWLSSLPRHLNSGSSVLRLLEGGWIHSFNWAASPVALSTQYSHTIVTTTVAKLCDPLHHLFLLIKPNDIMLYVGPLTNFNYASSVEGNYFSLLTHARTDLTETLVMKLLTRMVGINCMCILQIYCITQYKVNTRIVQNRTDDTLSGEYLIVLPPRYSSASHVKIFRQQTRSFCHSLRVHIPHDSKAKHIQFSIL